MDFAIEEEGLRCDEFLDITDAADADAIPFFDRCQSSRRDETRCRLLDENEGKVVEALDDLQRALDDFRSAYKAGVELSPLGAIA